MRNDDPQFMLFRGRGVSQQILNRAPCELDFLGFLVVRVLFLGTLVRWGQNPGVFHSHGATPIVGWFVRENPHLKYGWWLGVPLWLWTPPNTTHDTNVQPPGSRNLTHIGSNYSQDIRGLRLKWLWNSYVHLFYTMLLFVTVLEVLFYTYIYIHNHIYI